MMVRRREYWPTNHRRRADHRAALASDPTMNETGKRRGPKPSGNAKIGKVRMRELRARTRAADPNFVIAALRLELTKVKDQRNELAAQADVIRERLAETNEHNDELLKDNAKLRGLVTVDVDALLRENDTLTRTVAHLDDALLKLYSKNVALRFQLGLGPDEAPL